MDLYSIVTLKCYTRSLNDVKNFNFSDVVITLEVRYYNYAVLLLGAGCVAAGSNDATEKENCLGRNITNDKQERLIGSECLGWTVST